jgi:hypothetical protein
MRLAAWLLERSYIYGENKALNMFFVSMHVILFSFILYFCHPNSVCMQQVTNFNLVYRIA